MGNLQSDRNSGAKPALGKIDINKIPLNLPIVSNEIVSFRGEFVFFNEPVQSADPDAVISHL